jgi:hypothetical protein
VQPPKRTAQLAKIAAQMSLVKPIFFMPSRSGKSRGIARYEIAAIGKRQSLHSTGSGSAHDSRYQQPLVKLFEPVLDRFLRLFFLLALPADSLQLADHRLLQFRVAVVELQGVSGQPSKYGSRP